MTPEELAELKRANDLKEREVTALERISDNTSRRTDNIMSHRTKNCLETISDWWDKEKANSMRMHY